ncbi:MAG TPA: phosphoadenylyl-sulfate reductase [Acidimicrobiales bacterium]|nr:phosphoadenylyl-sulfate reductase [Acidimicrobiales bacterium]
MSVVSRGIPDLAELAAESARLEQSPAGAAVRWAHERFGDGLVLAASFQDAVLIDIAEKAAPGIEVLFLDTQYHFAETLWFVEELRKRYDLNLNVVHPQPHVVPDNRWQTDVEGCCGVRKVEPLARALDGRAAWITGLRRVDAPTRANAPVVSWDLARNMVKINPLAAWTDDDMAGYVADHGLPVNPLTERGYPSVGCWPCTRPVAPGEDPRSGRWAGKDKTECGLHA